LSSLSLEKKKKEDKRVRTIIIIIIATTLIIRFLVTFHDGIGFVSLPVIGDIVIQRIIRIRSREKSLDTQKNGANLKSRRPFVLLI
jgi:hypothetical protein